MSLRKISKRIFIYFVLIYCAYLAETSVLPLFTFISGTPNLLLIVVVSYGYIYGSTPGILCGIFAGFMIDLFSGGLMGVHILAFSYIGYASGLMHSDLANDTLVAPLILSVLMELFYAVFEMFLRFLTYGYVDIPNSLRYIVLPELFFTAAVSIFVYLVLLHASRKLDSIDNVRGQQVA